MITRSRNYLSINISFVSLSKAVLVHKLTFQIQWNSVKIISKNKLNICFHGLLLLLIIFYLLKALIHSISR